MCAGWMEEPPNEILNALVNDATSQKRERFGNPPAPHAVCRVILGEL